MSSFILLAIAAMTLAESTVPAGGGSRPSPIRLAVEQGEHDVLLQVVGLADSACNARYSLEVSGGGNRSTQRGTASLQPHAQVNLVKLRLASPDGRGWWAKLSVISCNGAKYEQHISAS